MSTRNDDPQPDAPDLGASVQLDASQTLAGTPGGIDAADALDAGYIPPDRPYVLDDPDATGMRTGGSHDERLAREQPEDAGRSADPERSGLLSTVDEGAALETDDAVAAVDRGVAGGAASAEEAAMHEEAMMHDVAAAAPLDAEHPADR